MTLTVGSSPFGHEPAGEFNVDVPRERLMYVEEFPRRMRAVLGGEIVADSRRGRLLHEHGRLARYFFPRADVWGDVAERAGHGHEWAALDGFVYLEWDAMDEWLQEDEPAVGHVRDPYHRVDVLDTSCHIVVGRHGEHLAESRRTRVLYETSLVARWYMPREDVLAELVTSDVRTTCAYKGHASYWSVRTPAGALLENVAWTYRDPLHDAERVRDLVCFFNEHVDLDVDGERQERPRSPWSAPRWWEVDLREMEGGRAGPSSAATFE
jgi:uncharacterized protein (DUF427 family)